MPNNSNILTIYMNNLDIDTLHISLWFVTISFLKLHVNRSFVELNKLIS